MNYKLELLKRLFKKLGKSVTDKEDKIKTVKLSTTISMHDLENKKRRAIELLKSFRTVKIYMKVNAYDEDNIQKGRLLLQNIAEDLKEYAKIKLPEGAKKEEKKHPKSAG